MSCFPLPFRTNTTVQEDCPTEKPLKYSAVKSTATHEMDEIEVKSMSFFGTPNPGARTDPSGSRSLNPKELSPGTDDIR